MTQLILPGFEFDDNVETIKHTQTITDDFLKANAEKRNASSARAGDFHQMASIPTAVVEKWMREGFNIFDKNTTAKEIVDRLRSDNLEAFLTSNKRL